MLEKRNLLSFAMLNSIKRKRNLYKKQRMKRELIIFSLILFITSSAFCQVSLKSKKNRKWPNGAFCEVPNKRPDYIKSIDFLVGFVPNQDYNAIKLDLVASNMLLKIIGFYTSFEIGQSNPYFTNIWGVNISIFRFLYLFGGIDIFTSYGVISNTKENSTNGTRKEVGIGLYPVKNFTLRTGYSYEVGIAFTAGYRFPISKDRKKMKKRKYNRKLPAYF